MPLESGPGKKKFAHNVKAEEAAGKPQKQAVAIAYSEQHKTQHAAAKAAHSASQTKKPYGK